MIFLAGSGPTGPVNAAEAGSISNRIFGPSLFIAFVGTHPSGSSEHLIGAGIGWF
ncbi:MAG TPA: hypothetical protein VE981_16960 [Planctomycetota bacterium]|nr:hypothetical protein [Planctomycetota bacterium]